MILIGLYIKKVISMEKQKILDLIKKLESVNLSIEKTIRNKYPSENDLIVAINNDNYVDSEKITKENFDEDVLNALEDKGIFIPLVWITAYHDDLDDEVEFDPYDEIEYEGQVTYEVSSIKGEESLIIKDEYPFIEHELSGHYGIKISKNDDGTEKVEFASKLGFSRHGLVKEYLIIINNESRDTWGCIDEIANQIAVESMKDLIIFE